eukprot:TCONS_00050169-protein
MENYTKIKDGKDEQVGPVQQEPFVLIVTTDNKFYQAVRNVGKILKEHGKAIVIGEGLYAQKAIAVADKIKETWYVSETIDIFDTDYKDIWIPKTDELGLENLEVTRSVPTTKITLVQTEKPKQRHSNNGRQQSNNVKQTGRNGKVQSQQNCDSTRNQKPPRRDYRNSRRSKSESEGETLGSGQRYQDKPNPRQSNGHHNRTRTEGDNKQRTDRNSSHRNNQNSSFEGDERTHQNRNGQYKKHQRKPRTRNGDSHPEDPNNGVDSVQNNGNGTRNPLVDHQKIHHSEGSNPRTQRENPSTSSRTKTISDSSHQDNEP